jgi:hypothetical protein
VVREPKKQIKLISSRDQDTALGIVARARGTSKQALLRQAIADLTGVPAPKLDKGGRRKAEEEGSVLS